MIAKMAGEFFLGDCLYTADTIADVYGPGCATLIYTDPPFATGLDFRTSDGDFAYSDKLVGAEYKDWITARLKALAPLLSRNGNMVVHCDYRASHTIRQILEDIFGPNGFRAEIIWAYRVTARGSAVNSPRLAPHHDTLLVYGHPRSQNNADRRDGTRSQNNALGSADRRQAADRRGRHPVFTPVTATQELTPQEALRKGFKWDTERGYWFRHWSRGGYTDESIAELDRQGLIYWTSTGNPRPKIVMETNPSGNVLYNTVLGDVWTDIPDLMHSPPSERTGYPTQKPLALLRRVVETFSRPGDLVIDPFAGSGTTLVAADQLGRNWIGVDTGATAMKVAAERLGLDPVDDGE